MGHPERTLDYCMARSYLFFSSYYFKKKIVVNLDIYPPYFVPYFHPSGYGLGVSAPGI